MARVDNEDAVELGCALNLSPVAAGMLIRRGYDNPESARAFLNPSLKDLPKSPNVYGHGPGRGPYSGGYG